MARPSMTVGDRSGITTMRVGQWAHCYLVEFLHAVMFRKTKGETAMTSELRQLIELWLEESHKHDTEQKKEYERHNCTCIIVIVILKYGVCSV